VARDLDISGLSKRPVPTSAYGCSVATDDPPEPIVAALFHKHSDRSRIEQTDSSDSSCPSDYPRLSDGLAAAYMLSAIELDMRFNWDMRCGVVARRCAKHPNSDAASVTSRAAERHNRLFP
jgi:hypothetical protein